MLLSDLLYAAPVDSLSIAQTPLQIVLQDPSKFEAPLDFSSLREIHKGDKKTFIIHVQDAHANLSGQQNLAGALDAIMSKYKISLVLVEGGTKDDTLTPLKSVATPQVWKKVAKKFLFEGKISGEEYLNLTSDHDMKIMGIEDKELYMESLKAYAVLAEKREEAVQSLKIVRNAVEKLKKKVYPQELLGYEKTADDDFEKRFKGLVSLRAQRSNLIDQIASSPAAPRNDMNGFPNAQKLAVLQARESGIDFDAANLEQAALVEEIAKKGGRRRLKDELVKLSRIKDKKVSQLNFLQTLFRSAKEKNISTDAYPALLNYEAYLEEFAGIDLETLLEEFERLEDEVYRSVIASSRSERSNLSDAEIASASPRNDALLLRSIDRYLGLLDLAFRIQMSTKEFKTFEMNEPDFSTAAYLAFMNRQLADHGYFDDMIPYSLPLEETKTALKAFYASVDRRDGAFLKNSERILKAEGQEAAILIAGGYHTSHLKKLFKEKGFSYAVLSPNVTTETNQTKYEKILLEPIKKEVRTVTSNLEEDLLILKKKSDGIVAAKLAEETAGSRMAEVVNYAKSFRKPSAETDEAAAVAALSTMRGASSGARLADKEQGPGRLKSLADKWIHKIRSLSSEIFRLNAQVHNGYGANRKVNNQVIRSRDRKEKELRKAQSELSKIEKDMQKTGSGSANQSGARLGEKVKEALGGALLIIGAAALVYEIWLIIDLWGFFKHDPYGYGWFKRLVASVSVAGVIAGLVYKASTLFISFNKDKEGEEEDDIDDEEAAGLYALIFGGLSVVSLPFILHSHWGQIAQSVSQAYGYFLQWKLDYLLGLMLGVSLISRLVKKQQRHDDQMDPKKFATQGFLATAVAPIGEEVMFRFLYFNFSVWFWTRVFHFTEPFQYTMPWFGVPLGFDLPLGVFMAIAFNANAFFKAHGPGKWFHHWAMGAIASYSYYVTGNLIIPISLHFFWNGMATLYSLMANLFIPLDGKPIVSFKKDESGEGKGPDSQGARMAGPTFSAEDLRTVLPPLLKTAYLYQESRRHLNAPVLKWDGQGLSYGADMADRLVDFIEKAGDGEIARFELIDHSREGFVILHSLPQYIFDETVPAPRLQGAFMRAAAVARRIIAEPRVTMNGMHLPGFEPKNWAQDEAPQTLAYEISRKYEKASKDYQVQIKVSRLGWIYVTDVARSARLKANMFNVSLDQIFNDEDLNDFMNGLGPTGARLAKDRSSVRSAFERFKDSYFEEKRFEKNGLIYQILLVGLYGWLWDHKMFKRLRRLSADAKFQKYVNEDRLRENIQNSRMVEGWALAVGVPVPLTVFLWAWAAHGASSPWFWVPLGILSVTQAVVIVQRYIRSRYFSGFSAFKDIQFGSRENEQVFATPVAPERPSASTQPRNSKKSSVVEEAADRISDQIQRLYVETEVYPIEDMFRGANEMNGLLQSLQRLFINIPRYLSLLRKLMSDAKEQVREEELKVQHMQAALDRTDPKERPDAYDFAKKKLEEAQMRKKVREAEWLPRLTEILAILTGEKSMELTEAIPLFEKKLKEIEEGIVPAGADAQRLKQRLESALSASAANRELVSQIRSRIENEENTIRQLSKNFVKDLHGKFRGSIGKREKQGREKARKNAETRKAALVLAVKLIGIQEFLRSQADLEAVRASEAGASDKTGARLAELDGKVIVRYSDSYLASGGVSSHLEFLNRELLSRHAVTIYEIYPETVRQTEFKKIWEEEAIGLGKIVYVPLSGTLPAFETSRHRSVSRALLQWMARFIRAYEPLRRVARLVKRTLFHPDFLWLTKHLSLVRSQYQFTVASFSQAIQKIASKVPPDSAIFINHSPSSFYSLELIRHAKAAGIASAFEYHGGALGANEPLLKKMAQEAAAAGVTLNGLEEALGPDAVSLGNGIDTDFFDPSKAGVGRFKERFAVNPDHWVILVPARVESSKGQMEMLRAASLFGTLGMEHWVSIVFAGAVDSEVYKKQLTDYAQKNLKSVDVLFTGNLDTETLREAYRDAHLVVLPSFTEGLPRVVLEAQSMEVPVIATEVGGTQDAVLEGQSGYIIQAGDVEGLAQKTVQVMQKDSWDKRRAYGEAGRRFVTENYSLPALARRHAEFYLSVMSGARMAGERVKRSNDYDEMSEWLKNELPKQLDASLIKSATLLHISGHPEARVMRSLRKDSLVKNLAWTVSEDGWGALKLHRGELGVFRGKISRMDRGLPKTKDPVILSVDMDALIRGDEDSVAVDEVRRRMRELLARLKDADYSIAAAFVFVPRYFDPEGVPHDLSESLNALILESRTPKKISRRKWLGKVFLAALGSLVVGLKLGRDAAHRRERREEKEFSADRHRFELREVTPELRQEIDSGAVEFVSTINPYRNAAEGKEVSGWLVIDGREISPRNKNTRESAMQKVIMWFDAENRLHFSDNDGFETPDELPAFGFQSGPMAVKDGVINEKVAAWHRDLLHGGARVLGVDSRGNVQVKSFYGMEPWGWTGDPSFDEDFAEWAEEKSIQNAVFVDGGRAGIGRQDAQTPPYVLVAVKVGARLAKAEEVERLFLEETGLSVQKGMMTVGGVHSFTVQNDPDPKAHTGYLRVDDVFIVTDPLHETFLNEVGGKEISVVKVFGIIEYPKFIMPMITAMLETRLENKVVEDLGSGSGILSLLALKLGAKRVIGVERDGQSIRLAKMAFESAGYAPDRYELVEKDISDWIESDPAERRRVAGQTQVVRLANIGPFYDIHDPLIDFIAGDPDSLFAVVGGYLDAGANRLASEILERPVTSAGALGAFKKAGWRFKYYSHWDTKTKKTYAAFAAVPVDRRSSVASGARLGEELPIFDKRTVGALKQGFVDSGGDPINAHFIEIAALYAQNYFLEQVSKNRRADIRPWEKALRDARLLIRWKGTSQAVIAALLYPVFEQNSAQLFGDLAKDRRKQIAENASQVYARLERIASIRRIPFSNMIFDARTVPNFINMVMELAGDYDTLQAVMAMKFDDFLDSTKERLRSEEASATYYTRRNWPEVVEMRAVYQAAAVKLKMREISDEIVKAVDQVVVPDLAEKGESARNEALGGVKPEYAHAQLERLSAELEDYLQADDVPSKIIVGIKDEGTIFKKFIFRQKDELGEIPDILRMRVIAPDAEAVKDRVKMWAQNYIRSGLAWPRDTWREFEDRKEYDGWSWDVKVYFPEQDRSVGLEIQVMTPDAAVVYDEGNEWVQSHDIYKIGTDIFENSWIARPRYRSDTTLEGHPKENLEFILKKNAERIYVPVYSFDEKGRIKRFRVVELSSDAVPADLAVSLKQYKADFQGFYRAFSQSADLSPMVRSLFVVPERKSPLRSGDRIVYAYDLQKLWQSLVRSEKGAFDFDEVRMVSSAYFLRMSGDRTDWWEWFDRGFRLIQGAAEGGKSREVEKFALEMGFDSTEDLAAALGSEIYDLHQFKNDFDLYVGSGHQDLPEMSRFARRASGARLSKFPEEEVERLVNELLQNRGHIPEDIEEDYFKVSMARGVVSRSPILFHFHDDRSVSESIDERRKWNSRNLSEVYLEGYDKIEGLVHDYAPEHKDLVLRAYVLAFVLHQFFPKEVDSAKAKSKDNRVLRAGDGTIPYIVHPVSVAMTLDTGSRRPSAEAIAAALLHDVLEDTLLGSDFEGMDGLSRKAKKERIEHELAARRLLPGESGRNVWKMVHILTKRPDETDVQYMQEVLAAGEEEGPYFLPLYEETLLIKLADKMSSFQIDMDLIQDSMFDGPQGARRAKTIIHFLYSRSLFLKHFANFLRRSNNPVLQQASLDWARQFHSLRDWQKERLGERYGYLFEEYEKQFGPVDVTLNDPGAGAWEARAWGKSVKYRVIRFSDLPALGLAARSDAAFDAYWKILQDSVLSVWKRPWLEDAARTKRLVTDPGSDLEAALIFVESEDGQPGEVVGGYLYNKNYGTLDALAVAEGKRGSGATHALMSHLIYFGSRGRATINLSTLPRAKNDAVDKTSGHVVAPIDELPRLLGISGTTLHLSLTSGPKVVIADRLNESKVEFKGAANVTASPDKIEEIVRQNPEILIVRATKISKELIDRLPNLKVILRAGHGTDNIDEAYAKQKGIRVVRTLGSQESVAALVMRMIVRGLQGGTTAAKDHAPEEFCAIPKLMKALEVRMETERLPEERRDFLRRKAAEMLRPIGKAAVQSLKGKKIGIVGFGPVGQSVAAIAKEYGMEVSVNSPSLASDPGRAERMGYRFASKEEIYKDSHFVVLMTGLTEEGPNRTAGMIDDAAVRLLRDNPKLMALINADRNGLIREEALLWLLSARPDAQYFSDDIPALEALQNHERVFYAPHIAASTEEAEQSVARETARFLAPIYKELSSSGARMAEEPGLVKVPGREVEFHAPFLAVVDLHGVLVQSNWKIAMARVYGSLMDKGKIQNTSEEAIRTWVDANGHAVNTGETLRRLAALARISAEEAGQLFRKERAWVGEYVKAQEVPGAKRFLEDLKARGIPIVVVSYASVGRERVLRQLMETGLLDIIGEENVRTPEDKKRDREEFRTETLHGLRGRFEGRQVLFFNDSPDGIRTVVQSGGVAFGFPHGTGDDWAFHKKHLEEAGAHYLMRGWTVNGPEILKLLDDPRSSGARLSSEVPPGTKEGLAKKIVFGSSVKGVSMDERGKKIVTDLFLHKAEVVRQAYEKIYGARDLNLDSKELQVYVTLYDDRGTQKRVYRVHFLDNSIPSHMRDMIVKIGRPFGERGEPRVVFDEEHMKGIQEAAWSLHSHEPPLFPTLGGAYWADDEEGVPVYLVQLQSGPNYEDFVLNVRASKTIPEIDKIRIIAEAGRRVVRSYTRFWMLMGRKKFISDPTNRNVKLDEYTEAWKLLDLDWLRSLEELLPLYHIAPNAPTNIEAFLLYLMDLKIYIPSGYERYLFDGIRDALEPDEWRQFFGTARQGMLRDYEYSSLEQREEGRGGRDFRARLDEYLAGGHEGYQPDRFEKDPYDPHGARLAEGVVEENDPHSGRLTGTVLKLRDGSELIAKRQESDAQDIFTMELFMDGKRIDAPQDEMGYPVSGLQWQEYRPGESDGLLKLIGIDLVKEAQGRKGVGRAIVDWLKMRASSGKMRMETSPTFNPSWARLWLDALQKDGVVIERTDKYPGPKEVSLSELERLIEEAFSKGESLPYPVKIVGEPLSGARMAADASDRNRILPLKRQIEALTTKRPIRRVLVNEDERFGMEALLKLLGQVLPDAELVSVAVSEDAWAKLEQGERFDLLVTDRNTNSLMTGIELMKNLERLDKEARPGVILQTGDLEDRLKEEADALGADFSDGNTLVIFKPVSSDEFKTAVTAFNASGARLAGKVAAYPDKEATQKALDERSRRGLKNSPKAIEKDDQRLYVAAKKYGIPLEEPESHMKYPDKASVEAEFGNRRQKGWMNYSMELERGEHPDLALLYAARKFKVALQSARKYESKAAVEKALAERKAAGLENNPATLDKDDRPLYRSAVDFGVPLPRVAKSAKYPNKASVEEGLKSRLEKGWPNNAVELQRGEYADPSLYKAAIAFEVELPAKRQFLGVPKYPDRLSVEKELKRRAFEDLKNDATSLKEGEKADPELLTAARKYRLSLPMPRRYASRKAVERALKERADKGWLNYAGALLAKGEQGDAALYNSAKKFGVALPRLEFDRDQLDDLLGQPLQYPDGQKTVRSLMSGLAGAYKVYVQKGPFNPGDAFISAVPGGPEEFSIILRLNYQNHIITPQETQKIETTLKDLEAFAKVFFGAVPQYRTDESKTEKIVSPAGVILHLKLSRRTKATVSEREDGAKTVGARLSDGQARLSATLDEKHAELRRAGAGGEVISFPQFYGARLTTAFVAAMTPQGPMMIPYLTPAGIAFISQADVKEMQKAAGARLTAPSDGYILSQQAEPAAEYRRLVYEGYKLMPSLAGMNSVLIMKKISLPMESEHIKDILGAREALFGEKKTVFFEFRDRQTGERIDFLSDHPAEIPKDAQPVLVGEAAEIGTVEKGWRFVPIDSVDMRDDEVNFLPLAPAFMAAAIVGNLNSLVGKDRAAQFFRRLTQRNFTDAEYQYFVKPDSAKKSVYLDLCIKAIARLPIERFLNGARLALQALGQSA